MATPKPNADALWLMSQCKDGATVNLAGMSLYPGLASIKIAGVKGLTIMGDGATSITRTESEPATQHYAQAILQFTLCQGLTLRGFGVGGPMKEGDYRTKAGSVGTRREGSHAIAFSGCTDTLVEWVSTKNVYGDGFYFGSNRKTNCARAVLRRTHSWNTGRHGLTFTSMLSADVESNCSFSFFRRKRIDIELRGRNDIISDVVMEDGITGYRAPIL